MKPLAALVHLPEGLYRVEDTDQLMKQSSEVQPQARLDEINSVWASMSGSILASQPEKEFHPVVLKFLNGRK
jgi:hypothetical protein